MSANFILAVNKIVRQVEAEVGLDALSPRARALLKAIAEENALGTAPRSGDLIALSGIGSPPTVYASLEELEKGGWIERRPDRHDARTRRICLTARSQRAFARMSRLILKGMKHSAAPRDPFPKRIFY